MKEIRIKLDYSNGPIWKDKFDIVTGELVTGIPVIDEDKALQVLNDEAERMYCSLYSFDEKNTYIFDNAKYELIKNNLLSLVQTIIMRLKELNDGTYSIVDEESSNLQRFAS